MRENSEVVIIYPFTRNREATALRVRLCQSPPRLGGMFLLPCVMQLTRKKEVESDSHASFSCLSSSSWSSLLELSNRLSYLFAAPYIVFQEWPHSKAGSSEIAWPLCSWRKGCNTPNTQSWCGKTGLCAKPLVNIEAPLDKHRFNPTFFRSMGQRSSDKSPVNCR